MPPPEIFKLIVPLDWPQLAGMTLLVAVIWFKLLTEPLKKAVQPLD